MAFDFLWYMTGKIEQEYQNEPLCAELIIFRTRKSENFKSVPGIQVGFDFFPYTLGYICCVIFLILVFIALVASDFGCKVCLKLSSPYYLQFAKDSDRCQ